MKKINLEETLKRLQIPEPDEERKKAAISAALKELELFRKGAAEKIKGSEKAGRLTSVKSIISLLKGGLVMNRPVITTVGIAALALLLTLSIVPRAMKPVSTLPTTPIITDSEESSRDKPVLPPTEAIGRRVEKEAPRNHPDSYEKSVAEIDVIAKKDLEQKLAEPVLSTIAPAKSEMPATVSAPSAPMLSKSAPSMAAGELKEYSRSGARVTESVVGAAKQKMMPQAEVPIYQAHENTGRDKFEQTKPNPVKLVSEEPVSTFSIDVDTASYAFIRRALNEGHLPQKDAVRVEEMINYFDYDYEIPRDKSRPFKPTIAVYPSPWNSGTKLLHIGIKGYDVVKRERPRANLVFLIDVSGSMESQDKLPLLKNSLKMLVGELAPEDTVAIAVYAGNAGTVLEPTRVQKKSKIIAALDRLTAGGFTAGGEGIRLAYSLAEANFDPKAVNRVILATDGDFNVGIQDPNELKGFVERKRKTGIFLSVLGFGQGNYNDALMQKLAQNGNGNAAYIDTLNEARKVLVEEAGATLFTIAKDVKIQVEFNPETVAEYRLIGYESRMLRREDFNNDAVDAGDIGSGHSVTAIYEITPVDSPSRLVDDLRYKKQAKPEKNGSHEEYAFLKIRYKLPDEDTSRLTTVPVDKEAEYGSISSVPGDLKFAAAVAAFGQILRGDPYVKGFGYDDVINLAEPARGRDMFGYRTEFLNLARLAKTARTMGDR